MLFFKLKDPLPKQRQSTGLKQKIMTALLKATWKITHNVLISGVTVISLSESLMSAIATFQRAELVRA